MLQKYPLLLELQNMISKEKGASRYTEVQLFSLSLKSCVNYFGYL